MEKEIITIIVDTLPVFYYEKMVGYAPSSFADLVFAGKRIEAGLKRGKFDHPALMNEKTGANQDDENEEGTHVESSTKVIPKSTTKPTRHASDAKTPTKKEFGSKKPIGFTPILVSYADLLPYLLDNSSIAITPAKVP
ncbi:hypothetical protein HKD37_10G028078 [Glycine soja]